MRHRFHALCPYFAIFPESFAEEWILRLSKPGEYVLDPFSGRGTTPFQAMLLGRNAIACDTNDVAYCLTRAKTDPPTLAAVLSRIAQLKNQCDGRKVAHEARSLPEFFHLAYDHNVLLRILYLRDALEWKNDRTDCMIAALMLGSLHGEVTKSGSYLSNQMPRTISTKPEYSVRFWKTRGLYPEKREVFELLTRRAKYRYESELAQGRALVFHQDMRMLPTHLAGEEVAMACAITSPPYFDVTHFEEDQWLRLWFLGGPASAGRGLAKGDGRHGFEDKYWSFIGDMWRTMDSLIQPMGHVVLRVGSRKHTPEEIERGVTACARLARRDLLLVHRELSEVKNRQTDIFRPGSRGVAVEVDLHYQFQS